MKILNHLRKQTGWTLRQVEDATGLSNAYLSQLENGKIKKPSAQVLYTLAKLYSVDYETLLIESGIVKKLNIVPAPMKVTGSMKQELGDLLCEYLGELKNDIANEFDWIRKEQLLQKEDAINLLLGMEPKEKRLTWLDKVMQAMEKTTEGGKNKSDGNDG